MSSFFCEVVMLQLLNIWFSNHFIPNKKKMKRLDYKDCLRNLPLYINQCLNSQKDKIQQIAKILATEKNIQIIGKGPSFGIAKYFIFYYIFYFF